MNPRRTRLLGIELLDARRVLAGNVVAKVVAGDLIVTGDELNNGIIITQVASGSYKIASATTFPTSTRINGGTAPVTLHGVTDDMILRTYGGSDRIELGNGLTDVIVPDDLTIETAGGNDTFVARRVRADAVSCDMGTESQVNVDQILAYNCTFRGTVGLQTGGGNDFLSATNCRVVGFLTINLGAGNDKGVLNNGACGGVNLNCGAGDDTGEFKGDFTINGDAYADGGAGYDKAIKHPGATVTYRGSADADNFEEDNI